MGLAFTAVERLKNFCCKSRINGLAYEGDPTEAPEAPEASEGGGGFLEIFGGCDERQKEFFEAL
jgi:serine/threonine protein kinase